MKIYINNEYQIKALRFNDTGDELTEVDVEDDFLQQYCDTVRKGFCYEAHDGIESVYPYKDFSTLESIQLEHEYQEAQAADITQAIVDNDYRLSTIELSI